MNGLLMTDGARAGAVTVAANRLSDIGGTANDTVAVLAIGVSRAEIARLAGNQLQRIGAQGNAAASRVGLQGVAVAHLAVHGNQLAVLAPPADYAGPAAGVLVAGPFIDLAVGANQVARDAGAPADPDRASWLALQVGPLPSNSFSTNFALHPQRVAYASLLALGGSAGTLVISGARAFVAGAVAAVGNAVPSSAAKVLGNSFAGRGSDPAVLVATARECQFSDNRVDHGASNGSPAVVISTAVAILSANRVRNNADIAVRVDGSKTVAAVANVTTGIIQVSGAPLGAPFDVLNLRA